MYQYWHWIAQTRCKIYPINFLPTQLVLITSVPKYDEYIQMRSIRYTGCSSNIMFFFQEFSKVCQLSLASTRLLMVVEKITTNRSDCTLALRWELWRSLTAMQERKRLQWIVKKHNFSSTPCSLEARKNWSREKWKKMDSVRLFWILKRIRRSMSYEVVFFFLGNHKCIDVNEWEIKNAIHDFLSMRSSESVI